MSSKKILITGASSGIGEALALHFAKKGATLLITSRKISSLKAVKEQCLRLGATAVHGISLNLEEKKSIESCAKEVLELGCPDVLINNAGVSQRAKTLDTDISVYEKLMQVNFLGPVYLTKLLLPAMLEKEHSQIGVISSLVGKFGTPYRSGYAAAKHALHGFFESLRAETNPKQVSITLICPGFIKTQASVNSLTGNGKALNVMDHAQAKGMLPRVLARKVAHALAQKKPEVLIGGKERFGVYIFRYWPNLFRKMVRKAAVR